MFYHLPPVGNPVCLTGEVVTQPQEVTTFLSYESRYFASGTAALAAAIIAAIRIKAVKNPEVILPAYACPDLVSAAVYAGAKVVLVDLEKDRPWMDLEQISEKICQNTVAVIAANLFGISERIDLIRTITAGSDVVLIEDSAQAFPGEDERDIWGGDMVILSFGRGKPVSLLGGGAVLYRESRFGVELPNPTAHPASDSTQRAKFRLKAYIYNCLISPRLYWIPRSLPFLRLGETRYHPLSGIEAMDSARLDALPANIGAYRSTSLNNQQAFAEIFRDQGLAATGLVDLPCICRVPEKRRLLRYPILVAERLRDRLYGQLLKLGLGPSIMYPTTLPRIAGLEGTLSDQTRFPEAEKFAVRVITLPTHSHVSDADIDNIRRVLSTI